MAYLISGGSGFLGRILMSTLNDPCYDLSDVVDQPSTKFDISQKFSINRDCSMNTVVHAAGLAHKTPRNAAEEGRFFEVNLEGTKNLCEALSHLKSQPRHFVFISSVAVYGVDEGVMISEDAPLLGTSVYARSKIEAEAWLQQWAQDTKITLSILRLPLLAGPDPKGNLRAMIDGIRSGRYFSIGKADAQKSILWAADVAAILPALDHIGGIYNLTDGYHPSIGELEAAISAHLNKRTPLKIPFWVADLMGKAGDLIGEKSPINSKKLQKLTSTLTFDDSRAKQLLGWRPTPVLSKIGVVVAHNH